MSRAVWLLLFLSSGEGLQIVTPSGTTENRPLTLYQAPRPYRDGRPLNSVIITSKPINLSKGEDNSTNDISEYKVRNNSSFEKLIQQPQLVGRPEYWIHFFFLFFFFFFFFCLDYSILEMSEISRQIIFKHDLFSKNHEMAFY